MNSKQLYIKIVRVRSLQHIYGHIGSKLELKEIQKTLDEINEKGKQNSAHFFSKEIAARQHEQNCFILYENRYWRGQILGENRAGVYEVSILDKGLQVETQDSLLSNNPFPEIYSRKLPSFISVCAIMHWKSRFSHVDSIVNRLQALTNKDVNFPNLPVAVESVLPIGLKIIDLFWFDSGTLRSFIEDIVDDRAYAFIVDSVTKASRSLLPEGTQNSRHGQLHATSIPNILTAQPKFVAHGDNGSSVGVLACRGHSRLVDSQIPIYSNNMNFPARDSRQNNICRGIAPKSNSEQFARESEIANQGPQVSSREPLILFLRSELDHLICNQTFDPKRIPAFLNYVGEEYGIHPHDLVNPFMRVLSLVEDLDVVEATLRHWPFGVTDVNFIAQILTHQDCTRRQLRFYTPVFLSVDSTTRHVVDRAINERMTRDPTYRSWFLTEVHPMYYSHLLLNKPEDNRTSKDQNNSEEMKKSESNETGTETKLVSFVDISASSDCLSDKISPGNGALESDRHSTESIQTSMGDDLSSKNEDNIYGTFGRVEAMLCHLKLQKFNSNFTDNMITDELLIHATPEELKDILKQMELPIGARVNIVKYFINGAFNRESVQTPDKASVASSGDSLPVADSSNYLNPQEPSVVVSAEHLPANDSNNNQCAPSPLFEKPGDFELNENIPVRTYRVSEPPPPKNTDGESFDGSPIEAHYLQPPTAFTKQEQFNTDTANCPVCGSDLHSRANCPDTYVKYY